MSCTQNVRIIHIFLHFLKFIFIDHLLSRHHCFKLHLRSFSYLKESILIFLYQLVKTVDFENIKFI